MDVGNNNLTKFCSFYVSDWHLVTMLLPYINKKINEEAKISIILERDLINNIEKLVEKLNIKNKEKILELGWSKTSIKERVIFNNESLNEKIIIINGSQDFIEKRNEKIEKYLKTHKVNGKIKIINCFEVTNYDGKISSILDKHDKIFNTSGEKEIKEVFEGYENKERKII